MQEAYNYSNLKNREKRIYSISGTTISTSGYETNFLKILGLSWFVINLIGVALCYVKGEFLYNPFMNTSNGTVFEPSFLIILNAIPVAISCSLWLIKIQNYRLIDFLIAYFKPKKVYDEQGKFSRFLEYKQNGFIERL